MDADNKDSSSSSDEDNKESSNSSSGSSSTRDNIVCSTCGMTFDTLAQLNIHVNNVHSTSKQKQKKTLRLGFIKFLLVIF